MAQTIVNSSKLPQDTTNIEKYDDLRLQDKVGSTATVPFFNDEGTAFWYSWQEAGKPSEYRVYDIKKGKYAITKPADFEHQSRPHINPYGTSPDSLFRLSDDTSNNLWLENLQTHQRKQLTTDGLDRLKFEIIDTKWLDGNKFLILRKDSRGVRKMGLTYYLNMPPYTYDYNYELPGDTIVETQQWYLGDLTTGLLRPIDTNLWRHQQITLQKADGVTDRVYFWRHKRTRDRAQLCTIDTAGTLRIIIDEQIKPRINPDMFSCHIVDGRDIFLWSDRSGWGHYYHYNTEGKLLGAITHGDWTCGRIINIDARHQRIIFLGYGREPGRNPNYAMAYSVGFNGKNLRLLTPEDGNHNIFVSSGQKLIVDIWSRINLAPTVNVRNGDGKFICTLEHTSLDALLDYGWRPAEPFQVMAADGRTTLYGIMWKPYNFNPAKKYPVISQVYPGPFTETVWTDFTVFDKYHNAALAQRGFVVIVMGHRGSSPLRSRDYNTYGYGNLRDYALEDDVCGLRQLFHQYAFMDSTRVGIMGHSGGAMMAFAALCTYPDFYRCAVCSSGNHDNRIYNRNWGENYQGIGDDCRFSVKNNQELAGQMQGHLLLATGDADQNVHPAHTMRLVDALIRNNKDFQLLVLPGQGHHYQGVYEHYFERQKRDFFERYLK